MNTLNKILLAVLVLILSVFFFSIYLSSSINNNLIDVRELAVEVTIGDEVGINLDMDPMNFGTVMTNGRSKRNLIYNTTTEGYLYLTLEGNISNHLFFERGYRPFLSEGVNYVPLMAYGNGGEFGVYDGVLTIYFFKKEPNFFQKLYLGSELPSATEDLQGSRVSLTVPEQ